IKGLRMAWRASNRAVTRVSSAAIAETSPSTRRARALTSSRFPIGVATTKRLLTSPSGPSGHLPTRWGGALTWSNSLQPSSDPGGYCGAWAHVAGCRRKDVQECLAVVSAQDPVVQDDHRTAVRRAPDQPAETLLESERRLRQGEL